MKGIHRGITSDILPFSFCEASCASVLMENNGPFHNWLLWSLQNRWMTKSKRVQDSSKNKRVHDFEIATER